LTELFAKIKTATFFTEHSVHVIQNGTVHYPTIITAAKFLRTSKWS